MRGIKRGKNNEGRSLFEKIAQKNLFNNRKMEQNYDENKKITFFDTHSHIHDHYFSEERKNFENPMNGIGFVALQGVHPDNWKLLRRVRSILLFYPLYILYILFFISLLLIIPMLR